MEWFTQKDCRSRFRTLVEAKAVLEAATQTRKPKRDRLMVELMLRCGLRASELLSIRAGDFKEESGIIYLLVVQGKGRKDRRIPIIHKPLQKSIKRYIKGMLPDEILFPMIDRNLREIVAKIGRKAGLSKRLHPHILRHTAATLYLRKGANIESVRRTLGHESLATTQKYLALTDEDVARDLLLFCLRWFLKFLTIPLIPQSLSLCLGQGKIFVVS